MKMKKAASNNIETRATKKQATKSNLNLDDVTRMKFLEQSAKYLGVSVKIDSIDLVDVKATN